MFQKDPLLGPYKKQIAGSLEMYVLLCCRRKKWISARLRFLKFLREQNEDHILLNIPKSANKRPSKAKVSIFREYLHFTTILGSGNFLRSSGGCFA